MLASRDRWCLHSPFDASDIPLTALQGRSGAGQTKRQCHLGMKIARGHHLGIMPIVSPPLFLQVFHNLQPGTQQGFQFTRIPECLRGILQVAKQNELNQKGVTFMVENGVGAQPLVEFFSALRGESVHRRAEPRSPGAFVLVCKRGDSPSRTPAPSANCG